MATNVSVECGTIYRLHNFYGDKVGMRMHFMGIRWDGDEMSGNGWG